MCTRYQWRYTRRALEVGAEIKELQVEAFVLGCLKFHFGGTIPDARCVNQTKAVGGAFTRTCYHPPSTMAARFFPCARNSLLVIPPLPRSSLSTRLALG